MEENKKPNILIVLSILIILLTLLVQISDSKINDFNNDITINQGELIDVLVKRVGAKADGGFLYLYQILKPDISFSPAKSLKSDSELGKIIEKYTNKEKTGEETFLLLRDYYIAKYEELTKDYNSKTISINQKISEGSPWVFWRNVFIICVLILIFLHLYLSLSIQRKNKNKR